MGKGDDGFVIPKDDLAKRGTCEVTCEPCALGKSAGTVMQPNRVTNAEEAIWMFSRDSCEPFQPSKWGHHMFLPSEIPRRSARGCVR